MNEKGKCFICGKDDIYKQCDYDKDSVFFTCPVCGRYELYASDITYNKIDKDKVAPYFFYTGFDNHELWDKDIEYRYYTTLPKEKCDEYNIQEDKKRENHGRPVHFDEEIIDKWFPKAISQKIDFILLKLNELTDYMGQNIQISKEALFSCTFVKRYNASDNQYDEKDILRQAIFLMTHLNDNGYITGGLSIDGGGMVSPIKITPKGYDRIDTLQRNNSDGKYVLVAMSFAEGTETLRESIRKGISEAGYIAVFIDEVEHNDFITPELLNWIRKSRFVVVDLTHKNNGAYFEEGYAMGLGKPVIQLCKKGVDLHFDIAQKNTIMWGTEEDIVMRLKNRIEATIY